MNIQIFENQEFGKIQSILLNEKPFFEASPVAKTLGYTNPNKAIKDHCKGVTKRYTLTNGGRQEVNFIPEGDIIRLVVRSKLPQAEKFESWIFDEVIPTILKTGKYEVPNITGDLRQQLQKNVNEYSFKSGILYRQGWERFREFYNIAFHTNIKLRKTNHNRKNGTDLTTPQYLVEIGEIERAVAVSKRMLETLTLKEPQVTDTKQYFDNLYFNKAMSIIHEEMQAELKGIYEETQIQQEADARKKKRVARIIQLMMGAFGSSSDNAGKQYQDGAMSYEIIDELEGMGVDTTILRGGKL